MPDPVHNPHWNASLLFTVEEAAREAGFDLSGVAPAHGSENALQDAVRFTEWIDSGHAAEMNWLKRRDQQGILLRSAVRVALPWARSVIVCAVNYNTDAPRSIDPAPAGSGWIGRYAWRGRRSGDQLVPSDYHDDLLLRLRTIEATLQRHAPCQTRCYVDTGPLVERAAAVKAGVGWVGKNTCILNQDVGSWLLLGVIVTSLQPATELPLPIVAADRCGSCTRCLDACPTGALIAPRQMDASLCIAYLTIEKKGEIPENLRAPIGRNVFGCDICQDVCPWNRRATSAHDASTHTRTELVNPSLAELGALDTAGFRRLFKGSPLERTGRRRLLRNVAIAMGNSQDTAHLPQLDRWIASEDALLASTATWARQRLYGQDPTPAPNARPQRPLPSPPKARKTTPREQVPRPVDQQESHPAPQDR